MTCSFTVDHHYHISQRFLLYTHTLKLRMTMNETLSLSLIGDIIVIIIIIIDAIIMFIIKNIITQHTQTMSNRTDRLQRVL